MLKCVWHRYGLAISTKRTAALDSCQITNQICTKWCTDPERFSSIVSKQSSWFSTNMIFLSDISVQFRTFLSVFDYAAFSKCQNLLDFSRNSSDLLQKIVSKSVQHHYGLKNLHQSERHSSQRFSHELNLSEKTHHFYKISIKVIREIWKMCSKIS